MKKTLALVLALAMVFSTITVAFAEETISADAQICADLGMLKGETGTVDAAYTATAPTRIQAAVMFLRLKGLEDEAKAFTGEGNFADADKAAWAKPIMAYLKANPQLGWLGDGTNFNPTNVLTAKEYYKVMLETLGYKQNTAEVVGDFTWDNVVEFAAGKGLSKVATVTNYTVNDLAIATVEALKATMKDGGKTLVASLIEAGKISKDAAIAAGLYSETVAGSVELVKAIGNTRVLVEFTEAIDKVSAENVASYKIEGLEVKAAVLEGTKQVVLETAEMTANKVYELTVGADTKKFGGVSKDTVAPALDSVEGNDTQRVTVTFTKVMDSATVLDKANYSISNDVTVESVAWDSDTDRDAVVLTTTGLATSKTYKLTVSNVMSIDLVALKSESDLFTASSDKSAPKFDEEETEDNEDNYNTNTRIIVAFDDDNELTKESAENLANWKITFGSNDSSALEITAAKLVEDEDDDLLAVELTTAPQKGGTNYTVHAVNLVDTSVLANTLKSEDTVDVNGKKADTDEPTLEDINYLSENLVEVVFDDDSRMDFNTLLDLNNYKFDEGASVEAVALDDAEDADCKTVVLTVNGLEDGETYELTVDAVADEYGNKMENEDKSAKFKEEDLNATTVVEKVKATDDETLVVTFNNEVKESSAEDVSNYSVSGSIGTPKDATLEDDGVTVTLDVAEMAGNTKYTVTVNGVVDKVGNTIVDSTGSAYVTADELDYDAPEVEDIEAVNNHVVRVTYNEMIAAGDYIYIDSNDAGTVADIVGVWSVSTDDDDMELEYTLFAADANGDLTTTPFEFAPAVDGNEYTIVEITAMDYAGNKCDDAQDETLEFDANADDPDEVEVTTWDQVSVKEFTIEFSEKVDITNAIIAKGTDVPYTLNAEIDRDSDYIVHLYSNVAMDDDEEFAIDLGDYIANYHGVEVTNEDDDDDVTELETNLEDDDEPYIEDLKVVDNNTVELYFNEELANPGDYSFYVEEDEDGDEIEIDVTPELKNTNKKLVTLTIGSGEPELEAQYDYELILESYAKDVAGNEIDETKGDTIFEFAGTDLDDIENYVIGVQTYAGSYVRVRTSEDMPYLPRMGVFSNDSSSTEPSLQGRNAVDRDDETPVVKIVYNNYTIDSDLYLCKGSYDYDDDAGIQRIRVYSKYDTVVVNGKTAYIPLFAFEDGIDYEISVDLDGDGTYRTEEVPAVDDPDPAVDEDWEPDYVYSAGDYDDTYTYEGLVDNDIDVTTTDGDVWNVQYGDMEDGDIVAFIVNGAVESFGVVSEDSGADVDTALVAGDEVSIMVVRDAFDPSYAFAVPVLYYSNSTELPTAQ